MRSVFSLVMTACLSILASSLLAQFTLQDLAFPGVYTPCIDFVDFDSDGDMDLFLAGSTSSSGVGTTRLYQNNGAGGFTLLTTPFSGIFLGSADWGDFNNDGYIDLVISGRSNTGTKVTELYRNIGNFGFQLVNAGFVGVDYSSVEWADYNLDGWLDLLVVGATSQSNISKIYRNNRNGTFTDIGADLCNISYGTASWGDYDNDGDPDLLFCGSDHAEVYENIGEDQFQNIHAGLIPVLYSAAAWGDYDNDGYIDILYQGLTSNGPITKLYRNMHNGDFEETPTRLQSCFGGSLSWGDYNCDGKLDIFLTGYFNGFRISKIYRNDDWGIFCPTTDEFPDMSSSGSTWADYNNDGKLDLFISGFDGDVFHSKLYRNDYPLVNTPPTAPTITYASESGFFEMSDFEDATTTESGLTFDIRIGTTPGGCDISSPLANPDGSRKAEKLGRKVIRFVPADNRVYYAAVQTIDRGFARSEFSNEISFCQNGEPLISLLGPQELDLGSVYLENTIEQTIIIANPGTSSLQIDTIELITGDDFCIEPVETPFQLAVGATCYIQLSFCPLSNGVLSDTLSIVSNAVNYPSLLIPMKGRGVSAPPAPVGNVSIEMIDNDACLTWSPVTETTLGEPIQVNRYVIFFNQLMDEEHFWYLANTPDLSFTHIDVGTFSESMFYKVVAIVLYDRDTENWIDRIDSNITKISLKEFGQWLNR